MKSQFLLSHGFKLIGWCILLPATVFGIILFATNFEAFALNVKTFAVVNEEFLGKTEMFSLADTNVTNTVAGIFFLVGAMLVGFSKEKREDEFIASIRLNSLLWAVMVNYILLIFAFLFVYGLSFLNVMVYNMFTVLILFIIRFNYVLHINSKRLSE